MIDKSPSLFSCKSLPPEQKLNFKFDQKKSEEYVSEMCAHYAGDKKSLSLENKELVLFANDTQKTHIKLGKLEVPSDVRAVAIEEGACISPNKVTDEGPLIYECSEQSLPNVVPLKNNNNHAPEQQNFNKNIVLHKRNENSRGQLDFVQAKEHCNLDSEGMLLRFLKEWIPPPKNHDENDSSTAGGSNLYDINKLIIVNNHQTLQKNHSFHKINKKKHSEIKACGYYFKTRLEENTSEEMSSSAEKQSCQSDSKKKSSELINRQFGGKVGKKQTSKENTFYNGRQRNWSHKNDETFKKRNYLMQSINNTFSKLYKAFVKQAVFSDRYKPCKKDEVLEFPMVLRNRTELTEYLTAMDQEILIPTSGSIMFHGSYRNKQIIQNSSSSDINKVQTSSKESVKHRSQLSARRNFSSEDEYCVGDKSDSDKSGQKSLFNDNSTFCSSGTDTEEVPYTSREISRTFGGTNSSSIPSSKSTSDSKNSVTTDKFFFSDAEITPHTDDSNIKLGKFYQSPAQIKLKETFNNRELPAKNTLIQNSNSTDSGVVIEEECAKPDVGVKYGEPNSAEHKNCVLNVLKPAPILSVTSGKQIYNKTDPVHFMSKSVKTYSNRHEHNVSRFSAEPNNGRDNLEQNNKKGENKLMELKATSHRILQDNGEPAILFNRCGFPLTDFKGRKLKNNFGMELLPVNSISELLSSQNQVYDCFNVPVVEKDFRPIKGIQLQRNYIQILGRYNEPGRLYNGYGYPLTDEDGVLLCNSQGNLLVILDIKGSPICCTNSEPIFLQDGTLWIKGRDNYNIIHYGKKNST